MAIVLIPVIFRGPTQGEGRVSVPNDTIRACFDAVEDRFPGLRELVIDAESGGIHKFVKLSLNGAVLDREPGVMDIKLGETDEIEVIAAIAGG